MAVLICLYREGYLGRGTSKTAPDGDSLVMSQLTPRVKATTRLGAEAGQNLSREQTRINVDQCPLHDRKATHPPTDSKVQSEKKLPVSKRESTSESGTSI